MFAMPQIWHKLQNNVDARFHRPTADRLGTHTSLMHPSLGRLRDNVDKVELGREDFSATLRFCDRMAGNFRAESDRQEAATEIQEYFGVDISPKVVHVGEKIITDATYLVPVSSGPGVAVLIRVDKNELGLSQASAVEESIGYYLHYLKGNAFMRNNTVYPTVLMVIVGPYIGVWAAVNGEGPSMDPMTPLLPLLMLPQDIIIMLSVARALKAVKVCMKELSEYYSTVGQIDDEEFEQLKFPYLRKMHCNGEHLKLKYEGKLSSDRLLYLVSAGDQQYVLKFVQGAYCSILHKSLASVALAPKLYHTEMLPGGWTAVLMELIQNCRPFLAMQESPAVQEKLKEAVTLMHTMGFVHGDLRSSNILVRGDGVYIIDFDWAGKQEEARYPPFLNHDDIARDEGAVGLQLIKKEHDLFMLDRLV